MWMRMSRDLFLQQRVKNWHNAIKQCIGVIYMSIIRLKTCYGSRWCFQRVNTYYLASYLLVTAITLNNVSQTCPTFFFNFSKLCRLLQFDSLMLLKNKNPLHLFDVDIHLKKSLLKGIGKTNGRSHFLHMKYKHINSFINLIHLIVFTKQVILTYCY